MMVPGRTSPFAMMLLMWLHDWCDVFVGEYTSQLWWREFRPNSRVVMMTNDDGKRRQEKCHRNKRPISDQSDTWPLWPNGRKWGHLIGQSHTSTSFIRPVGTVVSGRYSRSCCSVVLEVRVRRKFYLKFPNFIIIFPRRYYILRIHNRTISTSNNKVSNMRYCQWATS